MLVNANLGYSGFLDTWSYSGMVELQRSNHSVIISKESCTPHEI